MRKPIMKQILMLGIMLFIWTSTNPSMISEHCLGKNMLTVDDELGDADFICIQDAIDNATDGDVITVYSGTYESIRIEKSIDVEGIPLELGSGNDTGKPVIKDDDRLITLSDVHNCTIQGFDLLDGEQGIILFDSSHNTIVDNSITSCEEGITVHSFFEQSMNNFFINNIINDSNIGMRIEFSSENMIQHNHISNNSYYGMLLNCAHHNTISNNTFKANGLEWFRHSQDSGIFCITSRYNGIENNLFMNNTKGIDLCIDSSYNSIHDNTFLNNVHSAVFYNSYHNVWDDNYWNRPRVLPKTIIGYITIRTQPFPLLLNVDWHPAQELDVIFR
jgi:parallel beta-helix repeat protein